VKKGLFPDNPFWSVVTENTVWLHAGTRRDVYLQNTAANHSQEQISNSTI
jgi:hypothetical protein